jgi:O-antigen ligase
MRRLSLRVFNATNPEQIISWVVSGCAFVFPIVVLTVNRADSVILLVLSVVGILTVLSAGKKSLALTQGEMSLMSVFLLWYAVIVICYFMGDRTDIGFKMIGRNFRLALFIPAFIATRRFLKQPALPMIGLAIAPFAIIGLSLWQSWHGHVRVSGFVDAIPFGDLAIAMGFMSIAFLLIPNSPVQTWRYYIAGAGLAAGVMASILSESRGGWLAIPVMILVLSAALSKNSKRRGIKIFALSFGVVIAASFFAPSDIIVKRVSSAFDDVSQYLQYINLADSGELNHLGCINNQKMLDILAKNIEGAYDNDVQASVITGIGGFKNPNLYAYCQSNLAIKLSSKTDGKNTYITIQRYVSNPSGIQKVDFLIKGKGSVAINGINAGKTSFDNRNYELVETSQNTGHAYRAYPYLFIDHRHPLFIIPVQNQVGEYIYPLINNSIGQRLEMWRAAWLIFRDHPFMGAGTGSYMAEVKKISKDRRVFPAIVTYDHPHNDYLNSLSSQGLLGITAYLMALIYPLFLFVKALAHDDKFRRAAGYAGIIMVLGLLVFGMTETMFTHSIVMSWYVIFTAMLMAIIFRQQDTETRDVNI